MRCRKNLRTLFAEYNAASVADKPNTALMKLKNAILALKKPALHPSQLIYRADVAADIAQRHFHAHARSGLHAGQPL